MRIKPVGFPIKNEDRRMILTILLCVNRGYHEMKVFKPSAKTKRYRKVRGEKERKMPWFILEVQPVRVVIVWDKIFEFIYHNLKPAHVCSQYSIDCLFNCNRRIVNNPHLIDYYESDYYDYDSDDYFDVWLPHEWWLEDQCVDDSEDDYSPPDPTDEWWRRKGRKSQHVDRKHSPLVWERKPGRFILS